MSERRLNDRFASNEQHPGRRPALFAVLIILAAAAPIYFTITGYDPTGPQSVVPPAPTMMPGKPVEMTSPGTATAVSTGQARAIPRKGAIDGTDWITFKSRFIDLDGKLVDNHSRLSHSEGQGYAMLLAVAADDRPTFDRIWNWTRTNLRRENDALLSWKWKADEKGGGAIDDSNDATDADLIVAWALHRAAKQWQDPAYDQAATPIATAILDKLVRDIGGYEILLPGLKGFENHHNVTVNLSYWIFPAFRSLNEIVPSPRWALLEKSGLYLLSQARFGQNQLPSDWMTVHAAPAGGLALSPSTDKPIYGYDAVRIPLYLMWDGKATPEIMAPFLAFWRGAPDAKVPATLNVVTGDTAPYSIAPGMRAIVNAVENRSATPSCQVGICSTPALPPLQEDRDYYSAALGLLVRLALSEA